jgi:hypothetical protein
MEKKMISSNTKKLTAQLLNRLCGQYIRIRNRYSGEERLVLPMAVSDAKGQLNLGVRFGANPKLYWFNMSRKWELIPNGTARAA